MKNKINKNKIFLILGVILTFGLIIAVTSIKISNPFRPVFYTYSAYAPQDMIKEINKKYTWKEYGDAREFETALENNKGVAGITSDYSIISLIVDKKIAPLSLDMMEINGLENPWESYFTEATVDEMSGYNKTIDENLQEYYRNAYPEYEKKYGEGYVFKFSDFVIPYFLNDRLMAYDTTKIFNKVNMEKDPLHFEKPPTLVEALETVHQACLDNGKSLTVQWAKNVRENLVLGDTINDPKLKWLTEITAENYMTLLNNLSSMINEGTGGSMSNTNVNLFEDNSNYVLNNLINPSNRINVGMMYNGDALDAYYGSDNYSVISDGDRLRAVRMKYTVRLLDAFVISASVDREQRKEVLKFFSDIMFKGSFMDKEQIQKFVKTETEKNPNFDVWNSEGMFKVFNYANYTPGAKGIYYYAYDNYFIKEDGTIDEIARDIYVVPVTNEEEGIYSQNIGYVDKEVFSAASKAFQEKLNGF